MSKFWSELCDGFIVPVRDRNGRNCFNRHTVEFERPNTDQQELVVLRMCLSRRDSSEQPVQNNIPKSKSTKITSFMLTILEVEENIRVLNGN